MVLKELEWLPKPRTDFRACVRALGIEARQGIQDGFHDRVVALATVALDDSQLGQLAKLAQAIAAAADVPSTFIRAKLGLVGDGTLSLSAPPIVGSALRHGLLLEVDLGVYGAAAQEAADLGGGGLRAAGLDFLLLCPDARLLGLNTAASSPEEALAKVQAAFGQLRFIVDGFRPCVASAVLVQTLVAPVETLFGSLDRIQPTSPFSMVSALNRRIADWASEGGVVLLDIERLATSVGLEEWLDPSHWHASKLGFSPLMLPVYGETVARTIAALRGRSRKCLVLDLDNTLWGGVVGDDGVAGIVLGQGSAMGEGFLAIQRMALELRARGIPLAVCSKNEDDVARAPFREHPDMLIREEHIAVFQANWTDKASNIRAIAEALNIGIDALVFLDDNPAERLQVRRELPLVGVPELPEDIALYPRTLACAGYFETTAFSEEDRRRAGYYQDNAIRAAALCATDDIESYLDSLEMVCSIARVGPLSRARTAQLINKSNQYNLTTQRYSEAEVGAMESDSTRHVINIRLVDRFGDNGIISVIIVDKRHATWHIDTWLMSCRVLGRRVEHAALAHLVTTARAAGASRLTGRYVPSAKNRMVSDHYPKLGFRPLEADDRGATHWRLDLDDYVPPRLPMRIEDTAQPNERTPV